MDKDSPIEIYCICPACNERVCLDTSWTGYEIQCLGCSEWYLVGDCSIEHKLTHTRAEGFQRNKPKKSIHEVINESLINIHKVHGEIECLVERLNILFMGKFSRGYGNINNLDLNNIKLIQGQVVERVRRIKSWGNDFGLGILIKYGSYTYKYIGVVLDDGFSCGNILCKKVILSDNKKHIEYCSKDDDIKVFDPLEGSPEYVYRAGDYNPLRFEDLYHSKLGSVNVDSGCDYSDFINKEDDNQIASVELIEELHSEGNQDFLISDIASYLGESWPQKRRNEKISKYIGKSFEELCKFEGIGVKKAHKIIKILRYIEGCKIQNFNSKSLPEESKESKYLNPKKPSINSNKTLSYGPIFLPGVSYSCYLKWVDPYKKNKLIKGETKSSNSRGVKYSIEKRIVKKEKVSQIIDDIDNAWKNFWCKRGVLVSQLNPSDPNWTARDVVTKLNLSNSIYSFLEKFKEPVKIQKIKNSITDEKGLIRNVDIIRLANISNDIVYSKKSGTLCLKKYQSRDIGKRSFNSTKKQFNKSIEIHKKNLIQEHDRVAKRLKLDRITKTELLKYGRRKKEDFERVFGSVEKFLKWIYGGGAKRESEIIPISGTIKLFFGQDNSLIKSESTPKKNGE